MAGARLARTSRCQHGTWWLEGRIGGRPGCVAPRHGFEPRFTAPKAAVLPLDDRGVWHRTPMAGAGGGHRLLFKVTRAHGLNRGSYRAHASVPHGYQSE